MEETLTIVVSVGTFVVGFVVGWFARDRIVALSAEVLKVRADSLAESKVELARAQALVAEAFKAKDIAVSQARSEWSARRSGLVVAIGSGLFISVAACSSSGSKVSAAEPSSPTKEAVLVAAPVPATMVTAPPETFTMAARGLAETRRINVYTPPGYATTRQRVPVLYMPDGGMEEDFPHLTATVDRLIREGALPPMLVVGIENTERRRDLTGPTEVEEDRKIAPRVGGAVAFRAFLRDELMPEVIRRYCTSADTAIIGESLAGLFIVETLLLEPAMFRRYAALSPSLWWNGERLAQGAAAQLAQLPKEPRTLFAASAGDDILPGIERFAAALNAAAPPQLRASYAPRPDLLHSNIYRSLSATALTAIFAWPPVEGGGACGASQ